MRKGNIILKELVKKIKEKNIYLEFIKKKKLKYHMELSKKYVLWITLEK